MVSFHLFVVHLKCTHPFHLHSYSGITIVWTQPQPNSKMFHHGVHTYLIYSAKACTPCFMIPCRYDAHDMGIFRSALSCCVVPGLPNVAEYAAPRDAMQTPRENLKLSTSNSVLSAWTAGSLSLTPNSTIRHRPDINKILQALKVLSGAKNQGTQVHKFYLFFYCIHIFFYFFFKRVGFMTRATIIYTFAGLKYGHGLVSVAWTSLDSTNH